MSKALLGYMAGDSRLHDENQRLRRRIVELQALVLRLQSENDALTTELQAGELLTVPADMSGAATSAR